MALPNQVLPGFSASLWCQTGATPTPLTLTQLSTWTAEVANIVGTAANGTGSAGEQLNVEAIPAFGQDDASASFAVAGASIGHYSHTIQAYIIDHHCSLESS